MNLFKLTKDGKCVGYLKYDKYRPTYNNDLDVYGKWIDDPEDTWREGTTPEFDEMFPFVTLDKNGDKVFAGDKVKSGKRILEIIWSDLELQWKAKEDGYITPLHVWAISKQFELIKDKDNDS